MQIVRIVALASCAMGAVGGVCVSPAMGQDISVADSPVLSRSMLVPLDEDDLGFNVDARRAPVQYVDTRIQPPDNEKDEPTVTQAPAASNEPIRVSQIKVPSISLKGIGTGLIPRDVAAGRLPPVRPLPTGWDRDMEVYASLKQWYPSAICHKPVYFEDTMLERHGHERFPCVQSLASGTRFFATLPILPYLMTLHPPASDVYNLGHYRPGTAAPCLFERPPYDTRAVGVQVLSTTGAVFLIP